MPGRLTRLNTLNTARTTEGPRPRLKPRGLPPALEPHGVYAATNPADAALYGTDLFGPHRVFVDGPAHDFAATFHGVLIRDVTLGYLDYSTAVRVEVQSLTPNVLVIVPATGLSTITTGGHVVATSPVMAAIGRAHEPLKLESPADAAHLVVRIERDALETHLSRLLGRTVDRPIEFDPAFDLSEAAASRWNFAVQMLHAELYEVGSLLYRGQGIGPLEEFLMSALLYCQPSNYSSHLTDPTAPASRRALEAIDFIEQRLSTELSIADVAEALQISVRTLQNEFRSELKQSPTRYIQNRRLERARSDLADASVGGGATVTDIASRWGFTHLGRFAATYKSRFGESPSQTLRS